MPPPEQVAELPERVELLSVSVPSLSMPPPERVAELPVRVELLNVSVAPTLLEMPPPKLVAELPESVAVAQRQRASVEDAAAGIGLAVLDRQVGDARRHSICDGEDLGRAVAADRQVARAQAVDRDVAADRQRDAQGDGVAAEVAGESDLIAVLRVGDGIKQCHVRGAPRGCRRGR